MARYLQSGRVFYSRDGDIFDAVGLTLGAGIETRDTWLFDNEGDRNFTLDDVITPGLGVSYKGKLTIPLEGGGTVSLPVFGESFNPDRIWIASDVDPLESTRLFTDDIDVSALDTSAFRALRGASKRDDDLKGIKGDDFIELKAGNDTFDGRGGDDDVFGNAGDDRLIGGNGSDTLSGDTGKDFLSGGKGRDLLTGGNGRDQLFGGGGDDLLSGGSGNDRLKAGGGDDEVEGANGNDRLWGGKGADQFQLSQLVHGELGRDVIQDYNAAEGDTLRLVVTTDVPIVFEYEGNDTIISHGAGSITVRNAVLTANDVDVDLFLFG